MREVVEEVKKEIFLVDFFLFSFLSSDLTKVVSGKTHKD